MQEEPKAKGISNGYSERQQKSVPTLDEKVVGRVIAVLYPCNEEDGKEFSVWCNGRVLRLKKNNVLHVKYEVKNNKKAPRWALTESASTCFLEIHCDNPKHTNTHIISTKHKYTNYGIFSLFSFFSIFYKLF